MLVSVAQPISQRSRTSASAAMCRSRLGWIQCSSPPPAPSTRTCRSWTCCVRTTALKTLAVMRCVCRCSTTTAENAMQTTRRRVSAATSPAPSGCWLQRIDANRPRRSVAAVHWSVAAAALTQHPCPGMFLWTICLRKKPGTRATCACSCLAT